MSTDDQHGDGDKHRTQINDVIAPKAVVAKLAEAGDYHIGTVLA